MPDPNSYSEQAAHREISLKDLILKLQNWWKYLWSKWVLIAAVGVAGGAIGFFYANSRKPVYAALTTFVLEEKSPAGSLGQYSGLASMIGIDVGGGGSIFQGDNIIELYKSRTMIEKTLFSEVLDEGKKQRLVDKYIEFNRLREKWSENPKLASLKFEASSLDKPERLKDSVLGVFVQDIRKNYLNISKPDKKLNLIGVEIISFNESFSKLFNDQIVKNVNDFYIQTRTKKSLDNVAILQRKTDSVKQVMNGAIYQTVTVADNTPNVNQTRQVQRLVPMQRSQMAAETNKAMLSEMIKNLEASKMALLQETPLIQIMDSPVYPLEERKLAKAKGIAMGGLLGGFLVVLILIFNKLRKDIMA